MTTPFYHYDTKVLRDTLGAVSSELHKRSNYHMHYAVKANTNPEILRIIQKSGMGADCVSGGEIRAALDAGFPPGKIVFAGVGKCDWEICLALDADIFCFNVESEPELEVINELAGRKGKVADICLRINPDVEAHTHANITTGLSENKFGIAYRDMYRIISLAEKMSNINFRGLHFHIGSQIMDMTDFRNLCGRINDLQDELDRLGIRIGIINVGGGLGIDYENPEEHPIPDFRNYFDTYSSNLRLREGQELHFELGRAIVAQCGSLITKVIYVKESGEKKFVVVDAGMTDLIRPALYGAHHRIVNLSNQTTPYFIYDVVGPICESSDVFDTDIPLPETSRGDYLAILSAGAYGEIMASQYNCRTLPKGYTSDGAVDLAQILLHERQD